jgi:late competence protein required for DNA uptake (superfamily II DNA/RNA helicase)
LNILVSTTVVEVGVDVPNATLMVIEHAERFGLSQLHQLRGRIGRGEHASTCVLLYQAPWSDDARERLKAMADTSDGFVIAERDLRCAVRVISSARGSRACRPCAPAICCATAICSNAPTKRPRTRRGRHADAAQQTTSRASGSAIRPDNCRLTA